MPDCRLKSRLASAQEAFLRDLDRTTLAACAYAGRPSAKAARPRAARP
jgi:Rrf2 family nitric oxide-sensitive transcriptional repressor